MREILFRGKINSDVHSVLNGLWIEGGLRQDSDLHTAYIHGFYYYTDDCALQREPFEYEVDPATVGQYTELTDKNGKKVFEGDIVKVSLSGSSYFGRVEYECGCFWICNSDIKVPDTINHFKKSFIEVIGNIHDNPELVEV